MKNKYSKIKSYIHFKQNKPKAKSGLVIEFGDRGCGKSTDIAKDQYIFETKKSNYTNFYTNIHIKTDDPRYHYLDLINFKLTDYIPKTPKTINGQCYTVPKKDDTPFKITEDSIIEIDELGIIAHSRDYKNFPKEFIHLIKYLRHLGIYMKAYSQTYDIDKSIRQGATDLRLKRKFKIIPLSYSRKILKRIVCSQIDKKKQTTIINAEEQIHDELKLAPLLSKDSLHFTFIPFYTDRFDSFE